MASSRGWVRTDTPVIWPTHSFQRALFLSRKPRSAQAQSSILSCVEFWDIARWEEQQPTPFLLYLHCREFDFEKESPRDRGSSWSASFNNETRTDFVVRRDYRNSVDTLLCRWVNESQSVSSDTITITMLWWLPLSMSMKVYGIFVCFVVCGACTSLALPK